MKQLRVKGGDSIGLGQATYSALPIYLRPKWFELLDQFVFHGNGGSRKLVMVGQSGIECSLPVYRYRKRHSNRLNSLTNFYSPLFRLQSENETDASVYERFVQSFGRYFRCFDLIDFVPLPETDANHMCRAFERVGFRGFKYSHSVNWYEDNIAGFDRYWGARPARLRSTVRRKAAKLRKLNGFSIVTTKPETRERLWKYLGDFHQVYFASWKRPEPFPAFIDTVAEYAWESSELLLGTAYHGEMPIAAQIWFLANGTASIYKLAYRREYADYSVGSVLSRQMFQAAIEAEGVTCVDYLTGDDAYKRDWMTKSRRLVGIRLCNLATMTGRLHYVRNRVSEAAKKRCRVKFAD